MSPRLHQMNYSNSLKIAILKIDRAAVTIVKYHFSLNYKNRYGWLFDPHVISGMIR